MNLIDIDEISYFNSIKINRKLIEKEIRATIFYPKQDKISRLD